MIRLRRRPFEVLSMFVVPVLLLACGGNTPSTAKPSSYTLGAALGLSGAVALSGADFQRGAEAAVTEINNSGGIDGVPVKVQFFDNLNTAAASVSAITEFHSVYGLQATIMFGSPGVLATAPLATKYKMLMLNPGAGSPTLIGLSPFLFSNITNFRSEADAMLPYLKSQGFSRMVVYGQNDAFGTGSAAYIQPAWAKLGGTYLGTELEDPATVDHAAVIAKIRSLNPDIIYLTMGTRFGGTFVQQAGQLGLKVQIASWAALQAGGFLPDAGKYAEGIIDSAPVIKLDSSNPLSKSYLAAFTADFPTDDPNNLYSLTTYGAVFIYKDAIQEINKKGEAYNGDNLRKAISAIKTFQLPGGTTVFNPDGSSTTAITLSKIAGGQFVPFKTVTP
jgi:branched-chain amino acid transport system substrate-binding protein